MDTTAAEPVQLPAEAAGEWACMGWGDPLFLHLMTADDGSIGGSACAPDVAPPVDPPDWTNCAELIEHPDVLHTQAYWAFVLPYPGAGEPMSLELAVDYEPDELTGFVIDADAPTGGYKELTCMRWLPD